MNCLDRYRSKLVSQINRDLKIILVSPDEEAIHNFRVGMKRLTALFFFLNEVDPRLKTREMLKPYRRLAKSIGVIRDGHIAVHLIQELDEVCPADKKVLINAIKSKSRNDYRLFNKSIEAITHTRVSVPTIRSMGLSERAILRQKPIALQGLLSQIMSTRPRMTAEQWHKKRILLKRYHHKLDAFCFCPGHGSDESELKQIKILEQLLGDWHDRIIAAEILPLLNGVEAEANRAIAVIRKQDKMLLGSAKVYLNKFTKWHQDSYSRQ
jgi:CHAD domain-containing protein